MRHIITFIICELFDGVYSWWVSKGRREWTQHCKNSNKEKGHVHTQKY